MVAPPSSAASNAVPNPMHLITVSESPRPIGVLALQGAFIEHVRAFHAIGVPSVEVRTADQLAACRALVIPGGESSTMALLLQRDSHLRSALQERISGRKFPIWGTCAGSIILSSRIFESVDAYQAGEESIRAPNVFRDLPPFDCVRNYYGRQLASFEAQLTELADGGAAADVADGAEPAHCIATALSGFRGIFIRAPRLVNIETKTNKTKNKNGGAVAVAQVDHRGDVHPVAVRWENVFVTTFHPELAADGRVHRYFAERMCDQSIETNDDFEKVEKEETNSWGDDMADAW